MGLPYLSITYAQGCIEWCVQQVDVPLPEQICNQFRHYCCLDQHEQLWFRLLFRSEALWLTFALTPIWFIHLPLGLTRWIPIAFQHLAHGSS